MNMENIRRHEMDIEEEADFYLPEENSDPNISDGSLERGIKPNFTGA